MHADLLGAPSAKGNGRDGKPTLNFNMHSPLKINSPTASKNLYTHRHAHINNHVCAITQQHPHIKSGRFQQGISDVNSRGRRRDVRPCINAGHQYSGK